MKFYRAYIAGKHKLDRIDFFLVERRSAEQLRQILYYFGLGDIRTKIRRKELTLQEAETLCIIASKLLIWAEVEGLRRYTEKVMGIDTNQFFVTEVMSPLTKDILQDETVHLALKDYHQDGWFLALWANPFYDLPVKIGGFVAVEAQPALRQAMQQIDNQFTQFVQEANTLDDLLGDES